MLRLPGRKTYTSNEKVLMTLHVKSTQGTKTLKLSDVILVPSINVSCQCCDSDKNPNSWTSFDVPTVRKVSVNLAEI